MILAQVMISQFWDQAQHWALCWVWVLLKIPSSSFFAPPPWLVLSLSLSLSINKNKNTLSLYLSKENYNIRSRLCFFSLGYIQYKWKYRMWSNSFSQCLSRCILWQSIILCTMKCSNNSYHWSRVYYVAGTLYLPSY